MSSEAKREYWFARRYPLGNPRSSFAPVHWKGWAMAAIFVGGMLGAAGSLIFLLVMGEMLLGFVTFAILALAFGAWYLLVVRANSDAINTVADYRKGPPSV